MGKAAEKATVDALRAEGWTVGTHVSVQSETGVYSVIDAIAVKDGVILAVETKTGMAQLHKAQEKVMEAIERGTATVAPGSRTAPPGLAGTTIKGSAYEARMSREAAETLAGIGPAPASAPAGSSIGVSATRGASAGAVVGAMRGSDEQASGSDRSARD